MVPISDSINFDANPRLEIPTKSVKIAVRGNEFKIAQANVLTTSWIIDTILQIMDEKLLPRCSGAHAQYKGVASFQSSRPDYPAADSQEYGFITLRKFRRVFFVASLRKDWHPHNIP